MRIISALQVMQSAAGWYIGRSYTDADGNSGFPYSRESGYFSTKEEAKTSLFFDFISNPDISVLGWVEGEMAEPFFEE